MQSKHVYLFVRNFTSTQSRMKMPSHMKLVPIPREAKRRPRRTNNLTAKDAANPKYGGSKEMALKVGQPIHLRVQPTGFYSKKTLRYKNVKEMIPEFIVPDLTGFTLKPYVSYNVKEITQDRLTARDFYMACYAPKVAKEIQDGKYDDLLETDAEKTKS